MDEEVEAGGGKLDLDREWDEKFKLGYQGLIATFLNYIRQYSFFKCIFINKFNLLLDPNVNMYKKQRAFPHNNALNL